MAVRANQLVDFRGNPYVTRPEIEDLSSSIGNGTMAVKPFLFGVDSLEQKGNDMEVVIPGVVFNVFENATGIVYGDLEYLGGTDAGKTRVVFADWDSAQQGFGETPLFTAMAFVKMDGSPLGILDSENLDSSAG